MSAALTVNLGERSYPISFGSDLATEVRAKVAALISAGRSVAVLTDQNLIDHQFGALHEMFPDLPMHIVAPGETTKSLTEFGRVLDFLATQRMERTGALFTVGGGVIGDLGGFAAASYLRGIDYFQVPTTLLAMVDSSVGGKTGINLPTGKNLVGAFHQPRGVFISTQLLATLPPREFSAGMAEVIKYGLLGDAALFTQLEHTPLSAASPSLAAIIHRCCSLKGRIVELDERERAKDGGRALLNLGHTFGHAIEQVTGYGTYLHGEAVAIGLCAAARLSQKLEYISAADVKRIEAVVAAHALPLRLRTPLPLTGLVEAMRRDKKARAGLPRFIVLKKIGSAITQDSVPPALVETSFREVGAI
ncbi:MAG TPA: 3-dehydroquinate synthase [Opitutaceae bacterium]|jgi:3-dehydroquinate synthase|nr:3-dehydroquinate synthase [Opitutaceae bacterium]